jgi:Raf kinase inhibitor-like YbhB/YbcL family protein
MFGNNGKNASPDLAWSGFPEETQGFFLTMYDPDALTPSGFWHWVVINIPASVTQLTAGAGDSDENLPDGAMHLANDLGQRSYLGPATPPFLPPQPAPSRYVFAVSALDTADAEIPASASPSMASFLAMTHTIARAIVTPVYS